MTPPRVPYQRPAIILNEPDVGTDLAGPTEVAAVVVLILAADFVVIAVDIVVFSHPKIKASGDERSVRTGPGLKVLGPAGPSPV